MKVQHRIDLLAELGQYISANQEDWQAAKDRAYRENGWFIPEFTDRATLAVAGSFLQREKLEAWVTAYPRLGKGPARTVGIVMAGNIPLVGFHDWLSVFISGHRSLVKTSSRDAVLLKHLVEKLAGWDPAAGEQTVFADMLKGCDAYIATGSNNSSRYFEYYFSRFPHIIRKNRTSLAILTGKESPEELEKLADDVHLYFGLGCRNVTSIRVPEGYDFVPLLEAFRKYNYLADHHKYKNNYDYNLALHILNKKLYMTNGSVLLVEDPSFFSPISQLNYSYYTDKNALEEDLAEQEDLQCILGEGHTRFGEGQQPGLNDYADGVDSLAFLAMLS